MEITRLADEVDRLRQALVEERQAQKAAESAERQARKAAESGPVGGDRISSGRAQVSVATVTFRIVVNMQRPCSSIMRILLRIGSYAVFALQSAR